MLGLVPTWGSGATGIPPKLGWDRVGVMGAETCNI